MKYTPRQKFTIVVLCVTIGICASSIAQTALPNGILGVGPANPAGYCAGQVAPSGPNGLPWTYNCTDAGGTYGAVTGQKFVAPAGSSAAVLSFNARKPDANGNVAPASGDYTFSQIGGALSVSQVPAMPIQSTITCSGWGPGPGGVGMVLTGCK